MKVGGDAELIHQDESLSPEKMYARALDLDEVLPDPAQRRVIELLQARYVQLMQNPPQRPGTFRRMLARFNMGSAQAHTTTQGLYLWGGVGRGKR